MSSTAREPLERCRTAARDYDIWRRYAAGETQRQIGDSLGLDQTTVGSIIRRLRDDVPLNERRARQRRAITDLDDMRAGLWAIIDGSDDTDTRLKAMNRLLKVQEREARALGTDTARRPSASAEEIGANIKALLHDLSDDRDPSLIFPDRSTAAPA